MVATAAIAFASLPLDVLQNPCTPLSYAFYRRLLLCYNGHSSNADFKSLAVLKPWISRHVHLAVCPDQCCSAFLLGHSTPV